MENWTVGRFTITLKREHQGRTPAEVSGIVFEDRIGIHRDSLNGALHVTEIGSGFRVGEPLYDLGAAVRVAEGWRK